jgi:hypothetical protein
MPHSRGPPAPWQRARPALPARGPRVPRGCHGYVRRVPAPRAAAPRVLARMDQQGAPACSLCLESGGLVLPSRASWRLSASVSPSVKHQGQAERKCSLCVYVCVCVSFCGWLCVWVGLCICGKLGVMLGCLCGAVGLEVQLRGRVWHASGHSLHPCAQSC